MDELSQNCEEIPACHTVVDGRGHIENGDHRKIETLTGIIFSRAVRSTYSVLHLVVNFDHHAVVRIQCQDGQAAPSLRSWCRRACKLGDLISLEGFWTDIIKEDNATTEWHRSRFVVNLSSEDEASRQIQTLETQKWNMNKCQEWQNNCLPQSKRNNQQIKKRQRQENPDKFSKAYKHGGGIGKRRQGEYLANFLIHMIMHKLYNESLHQPPPEEWATATTPSSNEKLFAETVQHLNTGSGVLDPAGGSGHVSMNLGLRGVKSTVVDPRESVGKLPSRDRKVWSKAVRTSIVISTDGKPLTVCQPIRQFDAFRAWFAEKPEGVDTTFRNPDEAEIPVCDQDHDLLETASAIVALHPDEATDSIVDMAVAKQIPFCIVPCCVFARLFPHRQKVSGEPVSTYEDLIEYLMAKHHSIRKTTLPFEGANVALWSTFELGGTS